MDEDIRPGELSVGGYAAFEGNVGRPVRRFLGFDARLREAQRLERQARELRGQVEPLRGQVQTSGGSVRYISPDQLESWAQAEWDYSDEGPEAA